MLEGLTAIISKIIPGNQNSQIGEFLRYNKKDCIFHHSQGLLTSLLITDQLSLSSGSFHRKKSLP